MGEPRLLLVGQTWASPARHHPQRPHPHTNGTVTCSPIRRRSTPAPTSTTTPASSAPGRGGTPHPSWPAQACQSLRHIPVASTPDDDRRRVRTGRAPPAPRAGFGPHRRPGHAPAHRRRAALGSGWAARPHRRIAIRHQARGMSILDAKIARLDGTAATLGGSPADSPHSWSTWRAGAASRRSTPGSRTPSSGTPPAASPSSGCPATSSTGRGRERRRDRGVLLGDVRRHVPADREDRGQRRRPPRSTGRWSRRRTRRARPETATWNFESSCSPPTGPSSRGCARRSSPTTRAWSTRSRPWSAEALRRRFDRISSAGRRNSPTPPGRGGRRSPTRDDKASSSRLSFVGRPTKLPTSADRRPPTAGPATVNRGGAAAACVDSGHGPVRDR